MLNQEASQLLDYIEEDLAFLLYQHPSQQNTKRSNISSQGKFFRGIGSTGGKFGKPGGLRAFAPQEIVSHGTF
jgi:hypothetical protein